MIFRSFTFSLLVSSCFVVSLAAPTKLSHTARQAAAPESGFVFAAAVDGQPATVLVGAPASPPAEDVPPASPTPTASEETPVMAIEPEMSAEPGADTETPVTPIVADPGPEPPREFAYNVGGGSFGTWMGDPEDWVVGETAAFEIPEAVIGGAEPGNMDIYKSHRYGLLGSTWGYDLAVAPGVYQCTLHYAETFSDFFTAEPNRTFEVSITGDADNVEQKEEFDVMVELGGAEFTAYTRTFTNIQALTTISIRERPTKGDAFLSGISCIFLTAVAVP